MTTGGITTLVVGVAFCVRSPFDFVVNTQNWWALLVLLPVVKILASPSDRRSPARRRTAGVLTGVALVSLCTPGWTVGWPLLLVIMGLTSLLA